MPDESASRDAILDAAEALFATTGFAATTIKQIGAAADVNPALLYYYFGDKERLYHATLARLVGALVDAGQRRITATGDPPLMVRQFVAAQAEFLLHHPNGPYLLVREMVDHRAAHAAPHVAELSAGMFSRLTGVIGDGQRRGLFRADLDPRLAAISTIAQLAYFTIARPAIGLLLGGSADTVDDEFVRRFTEHASDFALAALTNVPRA